MAINNSAFQSTHELKAWGEIENTGQHYLTLYVIIDTYYLADVFNPLIQL